MKEFKIEMECVIALADIVLNVNRDFRIFTFTHVDGTPVALSEREDVTRFLKMLNEVTEISQSNKHETGDLEPFKVCMEAKLMLKDFDFILKHEEEWNPVLSAIAELTKRLHEQEED